MPMPAARSAPDDGAFAADDRGGVAVELALILPILVTLLAAILEVGVMGMMSNSLDIGLVAVSRMIRTGRTDGPTDGASFVNMVCPTLPVALTDCQSRLSFSVQRFSDFASAQAAASGTLSGQFDKGGPGDVILVHATYRYPLTAFGLSPFPSEVVLDARTTFRNEPYA